MENAESHLSQVGPDHVAIADGRETLMFSVQCLTTQAIHLCFTVREVRSQPLQLRLYALLFTKADLVCLLQNFQRCSDQIKFCIDLVEKFIVLGCLNCCSSDIAARVFSAAARREVNSSTCCWAMVGSRI